MKKILVIDDDSSVQVFLGEEIRLFGGNSDIVDYAFSGEEGIEKYMGTRHSIVFLDMKMGGINGLETFKRIHDFDKRANVFIVTGFTDKLTTDAIGLGAKGYISKNVNYISMMASLVIAFDKAICT